MFMVALAPWHPGCGSGDGSSVEPANIKALKSAFDIGNLSAATDLGEIYFSGDGVEQDRKEGLRWFLLAAERSEPRALFALGVAHQYGRGVRPDSKASIKFYKRAAALGNLEAQHSLAIAFKQGRGVPQSPSEANNWFRKAADKGHAPSIYQLGLKYQRGDGVPKDMREAAKWFQKAADKGLADAQYGLGQAYQKGLGVPVDVKKAAQLFKAAADQGHTEAKRLLARVQTRLMEGRKVASLRTRAERGNKQSQFNLAQAYLFGKGTEQDEPEALKWFERSARQGHLNAMYQVAVCFQQGRGTPKDPVQAVNWYRKAAEAGHPQCQYQLAEMLRKGEGVEADEEEALYWYEKASSKGAGEAGRFLERRSVAMAEVNRVVMQGEAAANGDVDAMYVFGKAKLSGKGTDQNEAEGVSWLKKAADQGHQQACADYAEILFSGRLVAADAEAGVVYCRIAAEVGIASAQFRLGESYDRGRGIEADSSLALVWYQKAADGGHPAAERVLERAKELAASSKRAAVARLAAEAGDPDAQWRLGMAFFNGKGVERSYEHALLWFRKSAAQKHADAEFYMGLCFEFGRGVKPEIEKAVGWYRKAGNQAHPEACFNMGSAYLKGRGVQQDEIQALEWFRQAAAQGLSEADRMLEHVGKVAATVLALSTLRKGAAGGGAKEMFGLGMAYYSGKGVAQDFEVAVRWFKKAAKKRHPESMFQLGVAYQYGKGAKRSIRDARKWYRKAADLGELQAAFSVGEIYRKGLGVEADLEVAMGWYEKAASKGHAPSQLVLENQEAKRLAIIRAAERGRPEELSVEDAAIRERFAKLEGDAQAGDATAQARLGVFYLNGDGVDQDYAEAVEWFQKASAQGDVEAEYQLGRANALGVGLPRDLSMGARLLERAAKQGHVKAQFELAELIRKEELGADFQSKSAKWYERAAMAGHGLAQGRVGNCFQFGRGMALDHAMAVEWYKRAANQGIEGAQANLARGYLNGNGVQKNLVQAYKWFAIAAKNGNQIAIRERDQIVSRMDVDERELSRRLANEWKPIDEMAQAAAQAAGDAPPAGEDGQEWTAASAGVSSGQPPGDLVESRAAASTADPTSRVHSPQATGSRQDDVQSVEDALDRREDYSVHFDLPVWYQNSAGTIFVLIPPGAFQMGSRPDDGDRQDDERLHAVSLTRGYYMANGEVTNGQMRMFRSRHSSAAVKGQSMDDDLQPAVNVSWAEAIAYCDWLGEQEGAPGLYRLPSEAEWEYAARAGTVASHWWGPTPRDGKCNARGDADGFSVTSVVGSFDANPWGLYDCLGNVSEWCLDWYGDYPDGAVEDPTGPATGAKRVVRGGSWFSGRGQCRASYRGQQRPGSRSSRIGFRVVALGVSPESR